MVSRVSREFLELSRFLAGLPIKTRLRLIDHTIVTLAGVYLLYLTLSSGLIAAQEAPIMVLQTGPLYFFYDVMVVLSCFIACEIIVCKLIL